MQIVIEIDDDMYKQIMADDHVYVLDDVNILLIENAIYNGTPLPKNHGDLIDRNELLDCSYEIDSFYCLYDLVVSVDDVKDAPTIIEEVKPDAKTEDT